MRGKFGPRVSPPRCSSGICSIPLPGEADYGHDAHQTQVTPSVTEPSLVLSRGRRWRPTEEGAPWSEMERGVSERRGRLGPGAGRHQARCADQSADQATMPAKSPDLKSCQRTLDQLLSHPIIITDGAPGLVGTKLGADQQRSINEQSITRSVLLLIQHSPTNTFSFVCHISLLPEFKSIIR